MKVGIIQPNVMPGDFPRNVRAVIEAYRACLDGGAELVVAPSMSLSGPDPGELLMRSAYAREHEDALQYMSLEIGSIPLILGSLEFSSHPVRKRYILTHNAVSRQENSTGLLNVNGIGIWCLKEYQELKRFEIPSLVRMLLVQPSAPWHLGETERLLDWARETALASHLPVAVVRHAGGQESAMYGGESFLVTEQGTLSGILSSFTAGERVLNTEKTRRVPALPRRNELRRAIQAGIQDFVRKGGYVAPAMIRDHSEAFLLLEKLASEALEDPPRVWETSPANPWELAENDNLLLISPCNKNALLLGARPMAHYLPLGDLFDGDIAQLSGRRVSLFKHGSEDDILHSLVDRHSSGTDLVASGYPERDVRFYQRVLESSAWKRFQAPPVLSVYGPATACPLLHRFSD